MKFLPRALPVAAVLLGAVLGSSSGIFIKNLRISSLAVAGFRMGLPLLVLLPVMMRRGLFRESLGDRRVMWAVSALGALRMFLLITAYKLTAVGNAVVLLYMWPIFALIMDAARKRRFPGAAQIGLIGLAFAGVVTMNLHRNFSLSADDLVGSLCMIASAALFALSALVFKKGLAKADEAETIFFQNAAGGLVFLPFMLIEIVSAAPVNIAIGLGYGTMVGLVGFGSFFYAMKRLPLFQYSALSYVEVVSGVLIGVLVFGESFAANQAAGAAMIIAASFLSQRIRTE